MEFAIKDKEGKEHFVLCRITINGRDFCITENQDVYERNSDGEFTLFDFQREEKQTMEREREIDNVTEETLRKLLAPPKSKDVVGRSEK